MRTRSNRAPECGLCGSRMKKNGHDRLGRQRWMCPGCRTTGATRGLPRRHRVLAGEWACYMKSAKPDRHTGRHRCPIPQPTTPSKMNATTVQK
ncbi:IS1/IS1595 family N-terminal zinc-binding domain-containing protein [Bifidobacterium apri]|uniref:IS1/IS1595 family N-terminal zinc-binding domain-containing protein n=1 Tax=Bifidobacterium apri TaxID=1769423 RepID=UPI003B839A83